MPFDLPFTFNFSAVGDVYKAEVEVIKSSFDQKKVVIFGKRWQADTIVVKSVFEQNKQRVLNIEIDQQDSPVKMENVLFKCSGGHTLFPYVFINGKYIGSTAEVVKLDLSNELKNLLAEPHPTDPVVVKNYADGTDLYGSI